MTVHSWLARAFATVEDTAYAADPSLERTARSALQPEERFPLGTPPPEIWPGMTAADFDIYHRQIAQERAQQAAAVSTALKAAAAAATAGCDDANDDVDSCSSVALVVDHDRVAPAAPKKARHTLLQYSQKQNAASTPIAAAAAEDNDSVSQCSASASNYMVSQFDGLPSQLGFSQIDHGSNCNSCSHPQVRKHIYLYADACTSHDITLRAGLVYKHACYCTCIMH
jgi:hypothetical protein